MARVAGAAARVRSSAGRTHSMARQFDALPRRGTGASEVDAEERMYPRGLAWIPTTPWERFCRLLICFGMLLFWTLASPTAARAQNTVVNFDDLPSEIFVNTQYEKIGLILNSGSLNRLPRTVALPEAPSAPNVLNISTNSPNEFASAYVQGVFTNPHHGFVSVRLGSQSSGGTAKVALQAYDLSNNLVAARFADAPDRGNGFATLFVFALNADIARFEVSSSNTRLFIDDVSFDAVTAGPGPDFGLGAPGVQLLRGGFGSTNVLVRRFAGSLGPILLTVSHLPPGVQVSSFVPNPADGPDGATSMLTLSADASATPVQNWPLQVTGLPAPSAGLFGPHSITVPLTILDSYDAQVVGIEVSQGVQVYDLPAGSTGDKPLHGVPVRYDGVRFASGGKTVVLVYADYATFPANSVPPLFDCLLYAFRDGAPLPGSPIAAENNLQSLLIGANFVTDAMRARAGGAQPFRFTLPRIWTDGDVTLRAVLSPSPVLGGPIVATDCCSDNDSFTLTDIPFTRAVDLFFAPFALRVNHGFLGYPNDVFEEARNLLPIGDRQFHMGDYVGEIDITDIWNQDVKACGFLGLGSCPEDDVGRGASAAARLKNIADDFNFAQSFELVVGIYPQNDPASGPGRDHDRIRSVEDPNCVGPFWNCHDLNVIAVQNQGRPRTSVAHELGHMLGRPHAGMACPDIKPPVESWPPDDTGLLQGVGVDRRTYQVLFVDRRGGNLGAPIYDFMSYCPSNSPDRRDSWISVRGWAETLAAVTPRSVNQLTANSSIANTTATAAPAAAPAAAPTPDAPVLVVQAFVDHDHNVYFTKVAPGLRPLAAPSAASPFMLVALDRQGKMLSSVPMSATEAHIDDADPATFLTAQMPATDAASMEIHENGTLIARQERSKHAPVVAGVQVRPDVRLHDNRRHHGDDDADDDRDDDDDDHNHDRDDREKRCNTREERDPNAAPVASSCVTIVTWHAKDADGDPLLAKVDYSTDDGRTWRPLFFGPNQNRAVLNSTLLKSTTHGRVRVRVNDGFNESAAVSHEFRAAGAPPVVQIVSPTAGITVGSAAALYLSGIAADENHEAITGSNLSWFAGDRLLGTGETLSVPGLPPGPTQIRLVARDARGVTASQSVSITIVP
jgi:hypothetical protein